MSLPGRSDPPDESGGSYESEANVRSAAADHSVAAYESEREPEGLYGALKIVPGGPYGAEKKQKPPKQRWGPLRGEGREEAKERR